MMLDAHSPAGRLARRAIPLPLLLGTLVLAPVPGASETAATVAAPPKAKSTAGTPAGAQASPSAAPSGGSVRARSAGFIPDSTVLARIGDRIVRAEDFAREFFDSDPQNRPGTDSAGRVKFLNTMVDKDVLGLVAREIDPSFDFEDRAIIREHTSRVISNILYQRMVVDSVHVTEQDVQRAYAQFNWELRLQNILFRDRALAEQVRRDIVAKKIPWSAAVKQHSVAANKDHEGELGWRNRLGLDALLADALFDLEPEQVSEVIDDPSGYQVVRVVERRAARAPALEPLRESITSQIRNQRAGLRARDIQVRLLANADVQYDEANCAWAATQFKRSVSMGNDGQAPTITIDPNLPEIAPADTARVLARYRDGKVTVGSLLASYAGMPPLLRPPLESAEAVKIQVDGIILEPVMVRLAYERGFDRDPDAVTLIERKHEQLMVEQMFEDSVQARVRVTDAMRRKFYENNKPGYFSYPSVRFAALLAHRKVEADSLKALLVAGTSAAEILRADSLRGFQRGSIQTRMQSQQGPYHKVLFEELRPGNVIVEGPDNQGSFAVIQLIAYDGGRQLAFAEVERLVDESVQNLEGERLLNEMIARHRKRFPIEVHPELVMKVDFRAR